MPCKDISILTTRRSSRYTRRVMRIKIARGSRLRLSRWASAEHRSKNRRNMSPHDSATKSAKDVDKLYDELSQDEQDTFDRIAATGFKPEPAGRGWKAVNANGSSVGPLPTLAELESVVFETVNDIPAEASAALDDEAP